MRPLSGIRVLDLGIITAGAATSAMLADLGAEVIKIESPTYRDPFRIWVSMRPEDSSELSPHYKATNRRKRALAINLKMAEGRACFLRLVQRSDVVVENFRRGVLDKLGIGYRALSTANRDIVLASISSQGETGPDAMDVSYGSTLESVAGMAWVTGYEGGDPMVSGVDLNYPDQVVAIFAAGMICTALASRAQGGGVHLDLSQRELTSFMIGENFAAADVSHRAGNADPLMAFQDCLKSSDGKWVAVSVGFDDLDRLASLIGETTTDPAASLSVWIRQRSAAQAVIGLQRVGIASAVSLRGEEVLAAEAWSDSIERSPDGLPLKGTPFNLAGSLPPFFEAPDFGEHSLAILREVAGYTEPEIVELLLKGVVEAPSENTPELGAKSAQA
ncbi:L-carnitine dehydratase/bile acid-inducible protein F [Rhizobium sp. CF080]|uniref:CaiB/BaiF CoA transferase family protein n=1 Tax=Rhizobium sp. (strain CF080) TaxID=1144310 RepID=UPI0002717879|nr:CaiB/BaiF CoA-transferase family protein [Rhizobium sp. CF080]EUB98153.1 L-carnitine dehydratase/bile acid-inducible protein F [Rhizobium sp. CF080]